jgi:hypothetical protein
MTRAGRTGLLAAVTILTSVAGARAQVFPVLQGDPVDGLGRALPILPGVALITANEDGDFKPPVVDPSVVGDVDLVVRAGHLTPGATMPPPTLVPPTAAAGGSRFPGGSDIPFTVIASDGDPLVAGGHPLLGLDLDGIPVVVFAFADLDRDGFVGPTDADAAGSSDNARELQESEFPVGMRVAYFAGGVAQGVIAADVGAPASAGGLPVVLTAAAYVGRFSPDFFLGTVPDGPAIATLLPFFPRLDPDRVIDTDGSAGPGLPNGRIAIELESEFAPPVGDPVLGTPFALPTDGSSVTIDRAIVGGAAVAGLRFVRPSSPAGFTGEEPRLSLRPGADGALFEPLEASTLVDDGPGNPIELHLVPVDVLGNVTDPAAVMQIELYASDNLVISSPDSDGDPAHEKLDVASGAGVVVSIDDAGGANDGGAAGVVEVSLNGVRDQRWSILLAGPPGETAPIVSGVGLRERPDGIGLACAPPTTLTASVDDADGDANAVTAVLSQNGADLGRIDLSPSTDPNHPEIWEAVLVPPSGLEPGSLSVTVTARDARGNVSEPVLVSFSVVDVLPPQIADVSTSPATLVSGVRSQLTVEARVIDACGVRRVKAYLDHDGRRKRFGRLGDRGKQGDVTAGDGVFSRRRRVRAPDAASLVLEIRATNRKGRSATHTVPLAP